MPKKNKQNTEIKQRVILGLEIIRIYLLLDFLTKEPEKLKRKNEMGQDYWSVREETGKKNGGLAD